MEPIPVQVIITISDPRTVFVADDFVKIIHILYQQGIFIPHHALFLVMLIVLEGLGLQINQLLYDINHILSGQIAAGLDDID